MLLLMMMVVVLVGWLVGWLGDWGWLLACLLVCFENMWFAVKMIPFFLTSIVSSVSVFECYMVTIHLLKF